MPIIWNMGRSTLEARLQHVQLRIEMLYRDRGDEFNLRARYASLVKLETVLLERLHAPNERRARELSQLHL